MSGTHAIKTDLERNMIEISLQGTIDKPGAEQFVKDVAMVLEQLREGFVVLSDIRRVTEITADAYPVLTGYMDCCNRKKVRAIARILSRQMENHGFMIMSNMHYGRNVSIREFTSRKQAVEHLSCFKCK